MSILQTTDLKKYYGTEPNITRALDGVTFSVEEGEFVAVVGTSGSGKSTLLNQLAGLEKPSKGRVLIGGVNISTLSEGQLAKFRQKNVGFIFQSYNLLPNLTATENVALPLSFRGEDRKIRLKKAKKYLKMVGLEKVEDHMPNQMSGGQQQRLCIARTLAVEPEVILMDEPTSALDPISTSKIEDLATELKKDYTIIMVTHNMQQATRISDKTAFFLLGEVVEFNDTDTLFSMPADKRTEDYITGRFG